MSPSATESDIKKAFRRIALKLHPDKAPDKEDEFKYVQTMILVWVYNVTIFGRAAMHAHQVLTDPKLRKRYNVCAKRSVKRVCDTCVLIRLCDKGMIE